MAIDFESAVTEQYVDFGTGLAVRNLANKTICAWINIESYTGLAYNSIFEAGRTGGAHDEFYGFSIHTGNYLSFAAYWNSASSYWDSAAGLSTGAWTHVCVTYSNSLTTNDPIFYINGAVSATTEIATPAGAYETGTGGTVQISSSLITKKFDGLISDVRVYNRILSAAEILEMYNRRSMNDNINGLVFNPVMYGCAAAQSFDGATLAAANKIVDPYSGALGTPSGSPVGVGETYLTVCP